MKRFSGGKGFKVYRKSSGVTSIRRSYGPDWRALSVEVKARDGYRCQKCGRHKVELVGDEHLEAHHIVPISKGGATVKTNLTTLCSRCHSKQPGHSHLQGPPKHNITKKPVYVKPKRAYTRHIRKERTK